MLTRALRYCKSAHIRTVVEPLTDGFHHLFEPRLHLVWAVGVDLLNKRPGVAHECVCVLARSGDLVEAWIVQRREVDRARSRTVHGSRHVHAQTILYRVSRGDVPQFHPLTTDSGSRLRKGVDPRLPFVNDGGGNQPLGRHAPTLNRPGGTRYNAGIWCRMRLSKRG